MPAADCRAPCVCDCRDSVRAGAPRGGDPLPDARRDLDCAGRGREAAPRRVRGCRRHAGGQDHQADGRGAA
eukprot:3034467-Prymnesium_polylepis.1